jgi:outer membrane biosynthesis protein TonB
VGAAAGIQRLYKDGLIMAKPEKRWQLLLVADDGRIIPFRRVKGIALTLIILLVLLGLLCAGLAWQLTAEKVRHQRSLGRLADATRQAAHFKSEHELIAAELVLAEARMQKAGLLISRRQERIPQQVPAKTADAEVEKADSAKVPGRSTATGPTDTEAAATRTEAVPAAEAVQAAAPENKPVEVPPEPKLPAVTLGELEMKHDAKKKLLLARFRVSNAGPRSSPVAGRCVVVLKTDGSDSGAWLAMPGVPLVDGKPDGKQGQAFRISRYRDMEIKAAGQADLSDVKTARVYVFDSSGAPITEKEFPVSFPAPKPDPKPVPAPLPRPAAAPVPVSDPAPAGDRGTAPADVPTAPSPEIDAGKAPQPDPDTGPIDDPSLTDGVEPVNKEDARSRF